MRDFDQFRVDYLFCPECDCYTDVLVWKDKNGRKATWAEFVACPRCSGRKTRWGLTWPAGNTDGVIFIADEREACVE